MDFPGFCSDGLLNEPVKIRTRCDGGGRNKAIIMIKNSFGMEPPLWFRIVAGGFPEHRPAHSGVQKKKGV
jgi:hypothetical protein